MQIIIHQSSFPHSFESLYGFILFSTLLMNSFTSLFSSSSSSPSFITSISILTSSFLDPMPLLGSSLSLSSISSLDPFFLCHFNHMLTHVINKPMINDTIPIVTGKTMCTFSLFFQLLSGLKF